MPSFTAPRERGLHVPALQIRVITLQLQLPFTVHRC